MRYLLGVDFGGGASKATLLAEDGRVIATSTKEYPTYYPQSGWTEQDPEDSYRALVFNVRAVIEKSGIDPADIAAMCLDAATHTAVLLDEADRVIRPAIYWTDKRSTRQSAWLKEHYYERIYTLCCNMPDVMWTLPQIMWVRENEPENFKRIDKILFMKDYVRYRLTGDFVTDYIDAMGSMFMDVPRNCWSEELCGLAGVSLSMLPRIVDPTEILGPLTTKACAETGLSPKTKVIAGATDTVLEVYANGAIEPGQMTVKLATAGRICPIVPHMLDNPLLCNYKHVVPGLWYPGTGTKSCAASYRWYRDTLCKAEKLEAEKQGVDPYFLMDQTAAGIPPGSDNLFFQPYLQGELTPYFDPALRGCFVGVLSSHTKAHFNRALLEGVAFSLKDCYQVVQAMNLQINQARIIGGGAKSPLWRQILCDMLGIELVKTENNDSSLGAAMLAGVAAGAFSSFAESVERCVRIEQVVKPDPENFKIYEKQFTLYKQIHDALAPVYHAMEG